MCALFAPVYVHNSITKISRTLKTFLIVCEICKNLKIRRF